MKFVLELLEDDCEITLNARILLREFAKTRKETFEVEDAISYIKSKGYEEFCLNYEKSCKDVNNFEQGKQNGKFVFMKAVKREEEKDVKRKEKNKIRDSFESRDERTV